MTIAEHEALRPIQAKPISAMTQEEYSKFQRELSEWCWTKDALIAIEATKGMESTTDLRDRVLREKACTPRADYVWRDIPKRKRAPRPAWSGATPQYFKQKQAERRAKIREGLAERKAS